MNIFTIFILLINYRYKQFNSLNNFCMFAPSVKKFGKNTIICAMSRVTIIDFRKVGQKGLKNEDKVGQKFILKRGQDRTEKWLFY